MPYVRYRGARPPKELKEWVRYENPNAPCRQGINALMAAARRSAEEQQLLGAAETEAIEKFVNDRVYDGLQYVGGVCFVADDAELRAWDETVPPHVYVAERTTIDLANAAWRQESLAAIEAANDLFRLPSVQHQSMRWRTRCEIVSYAQLEPHAAYRVGRLGYAYMRSRTPVMPDGRIQNVVDIYHDDDVSIEVALLVGREAAELLADLLAITAYGSAEVVRVIAISPPVCRPSVDFQMATFYSGRSFNSPVPVGPETLADFCDSDQRIALRHVRVGLSSRSPYEAFTSFYNAAELLADKLARDRGLSRLTRCKKCGDRRQAGWDLKAGFNQFYRAARISGDQFDDHRNTRGKIQHGSTTGDVGEQRQVNDGIGELQAMAVVAASQTFKVVPQVGSYFYTDYWPVGIWSCRIDYSGRRANFTRWTGRFAERGLPQSVCGDEGRSVYSGISTESELAEIAFPPVAQS